MTRISSLGTMVVCGIFGGGPKNLISWSAFPSARTTPTSSFTPTRRTQVGRGSRRPPSLRLVVSHVFDLFGQPSRAFGSSLCGSGLSPFAPGPSCSSVFGQLHRFSLPQATRGHSFVHLERSRSGASLALRGSFHSSPSPVHSRPSECSAFPPFGLLPRVLAKVRRSRELELTLVAPFWPQHPWFPDLLELLLESPFFLPRRRDLLKQPHFHHYHQNLSVLQLTVYRISSDLHVMPASLQRWLVSLPTADVAPLMSTTRPSG